MSRDRDGTVEINARAGRKTVSIRGADGKEFKVKYGEETTFTTFQNDGYGSAPTKITMELSFSELEILTRDRFGWELGNIPSP